MRITQDIGELFGKPSVLYNYIHTAVTTAYKRYSTS